MSNKLDDIRLTLICLQDINQLIIPERWYVIAFNRTLHTGFAPDFMWNVLIKFCCDYSLETNCLIGEEELFLSKKIEDMNRVTLLEGSIVDYLLTEYRFTRNHVLLDPAGCWAVRLDQDVTYFIFRIDSWIRISNLLGGYSFIEQLMLDEFDGQKGNNGIVENFVSNLLINIKTGT